MVADLPKPYVTSDLITNIVYVATAVQSAFRRDSGLSIAHYRIAVNVKRLGNAATVTRISDVLGLSAPFVSDVLDDLEDRGFVARGNVDSDRRLTRISLTRLGEEASEQWDDTVARYFKGIWKPLGQEHIQTNIQGALSIDDKHKEGVSRRDARFIQIYIEVPYVTMNALENAVGSNGLTLSQYRVLLALGERGGSDSSKNLKLKLRMAPSALCKTLSLLEDGDMVVRHERQPGKRTVEFAMTPQGRDRLNRTTGFVNSALTSDTYTTSFRDQGVFLEEADLICNALRLGHGRV